MLSQKVLTLVMSKSDEIMTQWTLGQRPGHTVLDEKINIYLTSEGYSGNDKQFKIKQNVRSFILQDMSIMGW